MREFVTVDFNETNKIIIRTREIVEVVLNESRIEIYYNSLKPDLIECKDREEAIAIFDGFLKELIYD